MGRTNRTYRDRMESLREELSPYRRALRHRDQDAYDQLWKHARNHADAAGHLNLSRELDAVLLSIVVAQERRITALETQLEDED
jgi:hypothetical protein